MIKKVETVARHHSAYGRDPYLIYPVMVGIYTKISVHESEYIDVFLDLLFSAPWRHIAIIIGTLKLSLSANSTNVC